ncbi:MAG: hypothetical protein ACI85Z_000982, partial [Rheinheimera aquimaris]
MLKPTFTVDLPTEDHISWLGDQSCANIAVRRQYWLAVGILDSP